MIRGRNVFRPCFSFRCYSSFFEPRPPSKTSSLKDILQSQDGTMEPHRLDLESPTSPQKSISSFFSDAIRTAVKNLSSSRTRVTHILSVHASRNNTIINLCDDNGSTLIVTSPGQCGLKKANRGTGDAAYQAAILLQQKAKAKEISPAGVHFKLNGFGPGRMQAFNAFRSYSWPIVRITDATPIRFAGCRPPKKRKL